MSSKIIGIVWLCLVFGLLVNPASTAENSEQKCPSKQSASQITECLRQKIKFIREEVNYLQDNYPTQNKRWNKGWNKYKKQTNVLIKSCEKKLAKLTCTDQAAVKKLTELKEKLKEHHKQIPLAFPSGPAGKGRFGAYYTKLKYSLTWDKPWRVGQHPDVVVQFDDHSYKFVFWRGANYIPCWVTENDIWFTNQFAETYIEKYSSSAQEPLWDIYCRYSHVRIIENNDARVVIHWRYALVDSDYKFAHKDPVTGWHDWADEYYYIYPNGTAMRKIILYSSRLDIWHEFQESIVLNPPGTIPEDKLHIDAMTVANLKGETQTYTWKDGPPEWRIQPKDSCIQRTNLKAKHKPFSIVPPENTMVAFFSYRVGDSYFVNCVGPANPHTVERLKPLKAYNFDKPTHTCLGWFIKAEKHPAIGEPRPPGATNGWQPYEETEQSKTKLLLNGLTEKSTSELAVVGRAWLQAPKLEPLGKNFTSEGYDQCQLAYVLTNSKKAKNPVMKFAISANEDSPVVDHLAFVVKNWGESNAKLKINGKQFEQGKNFRLGHRIGMKGTDLIVWVKTQSTLPIKMELASVKK